MTQRLERRTLSRITAVTLAGTLITLSPGIGSYSAMAQMISGAARSAGSTPVVPVVSVQPSFANLSLSAPASISPLPTSVLALPTVVPSAKISAAASSALPATTPASRIAAARAVAPATFLPHAAVQTAARGAAQIGTNAVSAPEAARTPKTALGVLRTAARGMARAIGAQFDGSRLFGGAAPAAINGVSEENQNQEPSEEAVRSMLSALRESMKKGEALPRTLQDAVADLAGVSHASGERVVGILAQRGHIAALKSGMRIFVDVPQNAEGALGPARAAVRDGLIQLNEGHIFAQAKAFNMLRGAVSLYAASVDHGNPAAKAEQVQAEILHLNAGLEFLRSYLKQVAERTGQGEDKANAQSALKMVSDSYFGADYYPDPLNKYAAGWLRGAAGRYKPSKTDTEAAKEFSRAVEFLGALADVLEQKAAPKALPAPGPKTAPFPIIKADDEKYKNLNKYGSNLTAKAVEGKLTPLIGRKAELRQMVKTLMRVEKNNPVVIGEKGVGKTKVVEGLAAMIARGTVPELAGVNIFKLDVTALVAGTKYRGEFEERLKGVMDETKAGKGKVLLFIDELHSIIGLGAASGTQDASQMLKEALSSGEMSLIGATTLEEYRKIEKDGALERRFNPIKLGEPTPEEAVEILEGVKGRYEAKHGVSIPKATSEAAVRLAVRYVKSRSLPDSALDLIDDASAEVALAGRTTVTEADVAVEINLRTGIPAKDLSDDDLASLKKLPEELRTRVIGQDEAVEAVAKAIRRGRLGYREEKAPIGTFMFLGPTGVGKTEFVRVLAKNQYGSEKNIVRIDMSEYQEKHSVSRLVGAPPGYVGFESAGQLTEAVRRNPHTLVLFDEIEKAAPEVLDVLLQVIEDGRLTDGQGRVVDFSNAIIVMTSNIGGSLAAQAEGAQDRTEAYIAALKEKVRPEFYNRIGKRRVVVFNALGGPELEKILDLRLSDLNARVKGKGMTVRLSETARRHIMEDAAGAENKAYGARPVKQAVAHEVEDALVDGELEGLIKKGDAVLVEWDAAARKLTVKKDPEAKTTSLGGWALGLLAPLAMAGLPIGVSLGLAVAGIVAAVAYSIWRVAASYSGPNGRAQAPPTARVWVTRAGLLTAALLAADFALKGLFWGSGLFVFHNIVPGRALLMAAAIPLNLLFASWMLSMGHSKTAPMEGLRRFRERHPVIGALAYGLLQVMAFPFSINDQRYAGDLAGKHPAVAKALGVFVIAAAFVLAGTLGNGLEGLINHRVVDFIPVGHGRANLADFLVFFGIPFAWMSLDFFGAVRKAVAARKPAVMNFAKFYALPVVGMLAFLLGSAAGYDAIPLPAIYASFFATLFGVGMLSANVYIQRRLAEFNLSLKDGVFQPMPSKATFSLGYRLRRLVAAGLAAVAALGIFNKVLSAPKLAAKDYAALVERYRGRLPKVVITDYDDTFMDNSDGRGLVISDARLKLLEDLKAAGVRVAFATNRPLTGGTYAMSHMLVDRMSPALRADFILSTGGGAEVFKFGKDGSLPEAPYFSGPTIAESERATVNGIIAAEAAKQGIDMSQGRLDTKPYEHAWMYGMGLDAAKKASVSETEWKALVADRNAKITAVYAALEKGLKKAGLEFAATLKFPPRSELEPYIRLSKSTKSFAVKAILEIVEAEGVKIDAEDVVMLGDDFTVPGYDSAMPKALPGGTAIAVGAASDARLANTHLLGGGPDATEKFLGDIIRP